jgi:transcriptional antiterminator NusG
MQENRSDIAEWYVVHTYSGYENKVMDSLQKTVENRGLQDVIQEIRIPVEEVIELKNNKRQTVQRKLYPGYVMVRMLMNENTWYIVRNTRGVTGFVGPGSKPVPLTEAEIQSMGVGGEQKPQVRFSMDVGEAVVIGAGPLEGFTGTIDQIDLVEQKVRVVVSLFGRETPVELEFFQVKKA